MNTILNSEDAYAALKIKDFQRFVLGRLLFTFGVQMQSVIVGWQVYELTKDALSLGLIGLAEILPFVSVALFAGHVVDMRDRKSIILLSTSVYLLCALSLLVLSTSLHKYLIIIGPVPIYAIIVVTGLARSFMAPAMSAFVAQLVPRELFGNTSTWNSMVWQIAAVTGPAIGGLVYGFMGVGSAYFLVVLVIIPGLVSFSMVKKKPVPEQIVHENIWQSLSQGLRFVFKNQMILSAITLDMFAVFFGGAVSMLPIFADQVLHTGAKGLGFLRAAPALGAVIMSLIQVYRPPFRKAGRNLLFCVLGFGICIILFAISKNFYVSLCILLLSGAFDNVSVIIRATIIQLYTSNEMRGRVSAVNSIFIGSSNELGAFESGVAAKIMGLIPSVIFGGCMTLGVVGAVRSLAPNLRKLKL